MKYENQVIERYESLQAQAKMIEKELNELKAQFIANGNGESESP